MSDVYITTLSKIGDGSFGDVYECTLNGKTGYAVKMCANSLGIQSPLEISIMKSYNHPNINRAIGVGYNHPWLHIAQRRYKCDISEIIKKEEISEMRAVSWFHQILSGLSYLHDSGIIHSDIKPKNILYDNDETLVITDFSLSIIKTKTCNKFKHKAGTLSYCAPEMLLGELWNEKVDVWSTGCLFYEILCGVSLIPNQRSTDDMGMKRTIECILDFKSLPKKTVDFIPVRLCDRWNTISNVIRDLITDMTSMSVNSRPSAYDMLRCNIFDSFENTIHTKPIIYDVQYDKNTETRIDKVFSRMIGVDSDIIDLAKRIYFRCTDIKTDLVHIETCVYLASKLLRYPVKHNINFKSQFYLILETEVNICSSLNYILHI